jgi:hypothetical protein
LRSSASARPDGSIEPPGFQPTENRYFVDSNFPVDGAALTVQAFREPLRFLKYLREGYAYALIETGQSYAQEYMPVRTTEATQKDAMTCPPLLTHVTAALQRAEEMRDEVRELFGDLEEVQQRLARRMALLREVEQYFRRGGDLTVVARKLVEQITAAANGTSHALGTRPEPILQPSATASFGLTPNPVTEAN